MADLEVLERFVGEWGFDGVEGGTSFEWVLGVIRVDAMQFDGRVWTLERSTPDFSELNFHQRFEGAFSDDGDMIEGTYFISHDEGATWDVDFPLLYRRRAG